MRKIKLGKTRPFFSSICPCTTHTAYFATTVLKPFLYLSFLLMTTSSFVQNKMGLRGTLSSQKKKSCMILRYGHYNFISTQCKILPFNLENITCNSDTGAKLSGISRRGVTLIIYLKNVFNYYANLEKFKCVM